MIHSWVAWSGLEMLVVLILYFILPIHHEVLSRKAIIEMTAYWDFIGLFLAFTWLHWNQRNYYAVTSYGQCYKSISTVSDLRFTTNVKTNKALLRLHIFGDSGSIVFPRSETWESKTQAHTNIVLRSGGHFSALMCALLTHPSGRISTNKVCS